MSDADSDHYTHHYTTTVTHHDADHGPVTHWLSDAAAYDCAYCITDYARWRRGWEHRRNVVRGLAQANATEASADGLADAYRAD